MITLLERYENLNGGDTCTLAPEIETQLIAQRKAVRVGADEPEKALDAPPVDKMVTRQTRKTTRK